MAHSAHGRWESWHPRPDPHPTNELHRWGAKTGSVVRWEDSSIRLQDNSVLHTAIPILTCVECQPIRDDQERPMEFICWDQNQVNITVKQMVQEWKDRFRGYYEFIDHLHSIRRDLQGPFMVSVKVCYKLNGLRLQNLSGSGRSIAAARADAARKLLESDHCMYFRGNY